MDQLLPTPNTGDLRSSGPGLRRSIVLIWEKEAVVLDRSNTPLTFLFTDIVGSTRMWQRHSSDMPAALEIHDGVVKRVVDSHRGHVFAGGGDGFGAVFSDPTQAIAAAVDIQFSLSDLEVGGESIQVRMGIHTGLAQERDNDYFGLAVNRAARLAAASHGRQILVSGATAQHLPTETTIMALGRFRLADLLEPMDIHQVGSARFPPIRALDSDRHNLPERYTSLVGRESLIGEVIEELERHRLVTLVGPGGIGKTTVASECGARLSAMSDEPRLEVWLARLDDLATSDDLDALIASLFGVGAVDGWRRTVAGRKAVLILDNAEHIIDEVAEVTAGLLKAGSGLRILVTSREPLQIPGERVIDVPPLPIDGDAFQLFLERAGEGHAADSVMSELVAATDGIPLALELVAAHIGRVPAEAVLESLRDHGIGSLKVRGVADRHRTTIDAIGWSYDILTSAEQRAFRAAAVFSTDFSVDGAALVGEVAHHIILGLVERSLIHRSGNRLRLLAPIKEFAQQRLHEANEVTEARDRLVELIVNEVVALSDRLKPRDGEGWERETTVDREDILKTAVWLIDNRDVDRLAQLYLAFPGQFGVHRRQLHRAMVSLDRGLSLFWKTPAAHRWCLYRHAWCLDLIAREREALPIVERLVPHAIETGDEYLIAACDALKLKILSIDPAIEPTELEVLQESAYRYAPVTEWWEPGLTLFQRGVHALNRGDFETAKRLIELSDGGPSESTYNRAITALLLSECDRMLGASDQALDLLDSVADVPDGLRFDFEQHRAHALIELGQLDEALVSIQRLVSLDVELSAEETSEPLCAAADYFRARGDHQVAVQMMANMLDDREPWAPVHRRVIEEGSIALGATFDAVWARGRQMTPASLHALVREEP